MGYNDTLNSIMGGIASTKPAVDKYADMATPTAYKKELMRLNGMQDQTDVVNQAVTEDYRKRKLASGEETLQSKQLKLHEKYKKEALKKASQIGMTTKDHEEYAKDMAAIDDIIQKARDQDKALGYDRNGQHSLQLIASLEGKKREIQANFEGKAKLNDKLIQDYSDKLLKKKDQDIATIKANWEAEKKKIGISQPTIIDSMIHHKEQEQATKTAVAGAEKETGKPMYNIKKFGTRELENLNELRLKQQELDAQKNKGRAPSKEDFYNPENDNENTDKYVEEASKAFSSAGKTDESKQKYLKPVIEAQKQLKGVRNTLVSMSPAQATNWMLTNPYYQMLEDNLKRAIGDANVALGTTETVTSKIQDNEGGIKGTARKIANSIPLVGAGLRALGLSEVGGFVLKVKEYTPTRTDQDTGKILVKPSFMNDSSTMKVLDDLENQLSQMEPDIVNMVEDPVTKKMVQKRSLSSARVLSVLSTTLADNPNTENLKPSSVAGMLAERKKWNAQNNIRK